MGFLTSRGGHIPLRLESEETESVRIYNWSGI
jgi:hypothetical protein